MKDSCWSTGKKTPEGAGTPCGTHTGHTGAHTGTRITTHRRTSQPSKPTNPRPSVAAHTVAGSREATGTALATAVAATALTAAALATAGIATPALAAAAALAYWYSRTCGFLHNVPSHVS